MNPSQSVFLAQSPSIGFTRLLTVSSLTRKRLFRKVATEAHKQLQEKKQPRQNKREDSDSEEAKRQLSGDIIPVKSESMFAEYFLSSNYQCGEFLFADVFLKLHRCPVASL